MDNPQHLPTKSAQYQKRGLACVFLTFLTTAPKRTPIMKSSSILHSVIGLTALATFAPATSHAASVVRSIGGNAASASVTAARDQFRVDIGGGTTAGANGSFGTARREINWDGVVATSSAPNLLAANFFNTTSPRGVVFSTPGTGFEVSGATTDGGAGQPAAANFGNINAGYTATFGIFSTQRLFTALGSNITDVNFFVPGTTTPAFINAFGAIFTDVDTVGSTTLEFFNLSNASLGVFPVPVGTVGSQSLSFLGVSFNAGEKAGRVRITSGNAALGAAVNDGGATDLVAMDDFIYSEPVPEPGTISLAGLALFGMCARRRRSAA
ncbi:MAG: PEP-CTERM sorting domain-containing protein [Chthoniobacteraceae bacterium]